MRRQLNTLYVTSEGAWLRKDGANIVMEIEGEIRGRIPVHMLESLVCIGRVLVSPPLLGYCAEQGITISYLTPNGKFLARVEGPVSGNVLLRREQYRRSDDPQRCAPIVANLLVGKVHNQRSVIGRALRDHGNKLDDEGRSALGFTHKRLARIAEKLLSVRETDVLRGLEGEAAQAYFGAFDHLVRTPEPTFRFSGRTRRPPLDAVNALLSFLYTLLTHDCRSALETVGLDPAVGYLHRDRPGRPSLALDLVEEFRPVLADRLALSLINRRQLSVGDFRTLDNGAVLLKDEARRVVLTAYQERKREELQHAFLEEQAPLGMFMFIQAQLLARHLRGDLDATRRFSGSEVLGMMVLVSYDVSTEGDGARRLRRVARACLDYGQRAQYSVFEIEVDPAQWAFLKQRLCDLIDPEVDSLRFYYLGRNWQTRVEHVGTKPVLDLNGPLDSLILLRTPSDRKIPGRFADP